MSLSRIKKTLAVLFVLALPGQLSIAQAAPLFLKFTGNGAYGDVNGSSFSTQNWILEYSLNDNAAVTGGDPGYYNIFSNAILGGKLSIGNTVYTLAGSSAAGQVVFDFGGFERDAVTINQASGGYLQFVVGQGQLFPALFGNTNSLSSANFGTTLSNSTTDPYNNTSYLNYQQTYDWFTYQPIPGVQTTTGFLSINASTPPASGLWTISVNNSSFFEPSASVPAPGALALVGLGLLGIGAFRRRKAA